MVQVTENNNVIEMEYVQIGVGKEDVNCYGVLIEIIIGYRPKLSNADLDDSLESSELIE